LGAFEGVAWVFPRLKLVKTLKMTFEAAVARVMTAIRRPMNSHHQISSIGLDVYRLAAFHPKVEAEVSQAVLQFRKICDDFDPELVAHQMRYAVRIADAEGPLLYEELHKLFSLCDEIHAMIALGLNANAELAATFEDAVRRRLLKIQRREARMVAQDKSAPWKASWWWYVELRDPSAKP